MDRQADAYKAFIFLRAARVDVRLRLDGTTWYGKVSVRDVHFHMSTIMENYPSKNTCSYLW